MLYALLGDATAHTHLRLLSRNPSPWRGRRGGTDVMLGVLVASHSRGPDPVNARWGEREREREREMRKCKEEVDHPIE